MVHPSASWKTFRPPESFLHPAATAEAVNGMVRSLEGWQNYKSAQEEREDLNSLVKDYIARGFCHRLESMAEAERELGRPPVLNKLGVVVKYAASGRKKSRIIWDLRESRANSICNQKERILLPKLLDLAEHTLKCFRMGKEVWLAAVDIKDAFMNVRRLARPGHGAGVALDGPTGFSEASREFSSVLLWFAATGFPVKLEKAEGGKSINWVGATLVVDHEAREVTVSIPKEKVEKLQETTSCFLKRPVVGHRQLRSYAGSLSFVAGLVPHLRPFLSTIWAALAGVSTANDGAPKGHSGKLLHTRRFKAALRWIEALLRGEPAPLSRVLSAKYIETEATITTDASAWGVGGVLRVNGRPLECFSSPIPKAALERFKAEIGKSKYNTVWEGLALLIAFRLWLPSLGYGAQVRAKSDNLGLTNLEADSLSRQFSPNPPTWPLSLAGATVRLVVMTNDFWRVQENTRGWPLASTHKPVAKARPGVLHEGFAIRIPSGSEATLVSTATPAATPAKAPSTPCQRPADGEPRPYNRGSTMAALAAMSNPEECVRHLKSGFQAETTKGPAASRRSLWNTLATKAGYTDPFTLEPQMIYAVMGALDMAGYRSAELYLDAAKGVHISEGNPWTQQLQQAAKAAIRSCKRARGPPKQAAGLPMSRLKDIAVHSPLAEGGPVWPARATLLAAWWLLREIEASRAKKKHITIYETEKRVTWRLPSSKTDQAALGAERSHTCSCAFSAPALCPYHLMVQHLTAVQHEEDFLFQDSMGGKTTKQGWTATFQALAKMMDLQVYNNNGAPLYTGHTARVTGARHLAAANIELWRIQLFGRWGSEVFLHYIQDTPLAQLGNLSQESSAQLSIQMAKEELSALIRQAQSLKPQLALPDLEMLQDCESAAEALPPPPHSDSEFILNSNGGGKLHRVLDRDPSQHPRTWRTWCGWRFARDTAEHTCIDPAQAHSYPDRARCSKCFPETRHTASTSSSSSTDSDADSSHS
eukprot:s1426_g32.t1